MKLHNLLIKCLLSCIFLGSTSFYSLKAQLNTDLPNIMLIFTDDQGYRDVSYYSTDDLQTPHIDQVAEEGP